MASASDEISQMIERVRQEAYSQGYQDAMNELNDFLSARAAGGSRGGRKKKSASAASSAAAPSRRTATARRGRRQTPSGRAPRGHVRTVIRQVLSQADGQKLPAGEIYRIATEQGESIAYSSVRFALQQMEKNDEVDHVGTEWQLKDGGGQ